jgi:hypothetical protein
MQEVRQKYPQYNDLSDEQLAGALHKKYYSDIPYEQFAAKIGLAAADTEKPHDVSSILSRMYELGPAESVKRIGGGLAEGAKNLATGVIESGVNAATLGSRVMDGEVPVFDASGRTSPELIAESFNAATWASPASVAMGTGKQIARNAALEAAKRPPSEGAQVAQAARNLNVTLPRAVTSDSAAVNQLGKTVANIPIAGQPLRKASKTAIQQMDDAARGVQDDLGTGSKQVAGNRIRQDMSSFSKIEEPAQVSALYSKVDRLVKPDVRIPLSETQRIAQNITARRNASKLEGSSAVGFIERALQSKGGMSYDEIKNLRTAVGELKKNKSELAQRKISDTEIDAIYNGLSTDLKNAVKTGGGPDALRAFEEANTRAKTFARDKEALNKVIGQGSDENITSRLIALAGNTSRANIKDLMLAKAKVSKETWDELAAAALNDMGRDASGAFTPDRFVTSWGKMSESGKKLVFGQNPQHLKALDDLATVSTRFKRLNEYANPSGTAQSVLGGSYFTGLYVAPTTTISALIGANMTARLLAKPASAKAVADYAKAYEMAVRMPGRATQNGLAEKAKALALVAANGNEVGASNLAAKLATVQQTAADQENNEQVGRPEGDPEAAQSSQQFNDAYLQGRAF